LSNNVITPTSVNERSQTIDIIRAFALFGVVVANFTVDNQDISPAEGRTGLLDQLVYWPIRFFIDDKAMAVYCFLFGLGFSIILLRASQRKANFITLHLRRMLALFIIGSIAYILSAETIPHEYALVGVLLLLFYRLPLKFLPLLGILCLLIPWGLQLNSQVRTTRKMNLRSVITMNKQHLNRYSGVYENARGQRIIIQQVGTWLDAEGPGKHFYLLPLSDSEFLRPDVNHLFVFRRSAIDSLNRLMIHTPEGKVIENKKTEASIQPALKEQYLKRSKRKFDEEPSYAAVVSSNAIGLWNRFRHWQWNDQLIVSDISMILSYFLFGLYVGRRKIFFEVAKNRSFLKKVRWWGMVVGSSGTLFYLFIEARDLVQHRDWSFYPQLTNSLFDFSWILSVFSLTIGYIASLTLLLEKKVWQRRLSFLAPVGRMGLTNYLLHVIPYVILFHQGLHLSGKIGPFYRLLLALPVYGLLIALSGFWFKNFIMGPFEWLWRSATYLKFQPIKARRN
jgi:uncharacterized protein